MATNPPITIGELSNVPAPGSGVNSPWAQQVTGRIIHRFANAAARDAAFPAPVNGLTAYTATEDIEWSYGPGGWRARNRPFGALATALGTSNSTVYTPALGGSPGVNPSVSLVTGAEVKVELSAQISLSGTNAAFMGVAVSGATTVAASDLRAAVLSGVALGASVAHSSIISGLTPGVNVFTLQYRVSANTHSFAVRSLVVTPL